jgi:hypothetical protein
MYACSWTVLVSCFWFCNEMIMLHFWFHAVDDYAIDDFLLVLYACSSLFWLRKNKIQMWLGSNFLCIFSLNFPTPKIQPSHISRSYFYQWHMGPMLHEALLLVLAATSCVHSPISSDGLPSDLPWVWQCDLSEAALAHSLLARSICRRRLTSLSPGPTRALVRPPQWGASRRHPRLPLSLPSSMRRIQELEIMEVLKE